MPQNISLSSVNNKDVLLNFDGAEMASDAGLMHLSKVERQLGFSKSLAPCLDDPRDPGKTRHNLEEVFRFRSTMVAAGYKDGNDANQLRHDSGFKLVLERGPETGAALCSQPTISRIENLPDTRTLIRMGRQMVRKYCVSYERAPGPVVFDVDDTFDAAYGEQQLCLFNGYYGNFGFQPIAVYDESGRLMGSVLRPATRPSGKEAAAHIR